MKFGVAIPNCEEGLMYPVDFVSPEYLVQTAVEAESLGYESIWVNDHFTIQDYLRHLKPRPNYFEPFTTLSFVAAATKRIKLATAVTVLPIRNPVVLAKTAATLDVFSKGRLILGVGLGAYREEFERVRPELNSKLRPVLLDEGLAALRKLFDQTTASYEGRMIRFGNIEINPKPVQKPFPIFVGGNAKSGISRTVQYGNGWNPACIPPHLVRSGVQQLADECRKRSRDISSIEIAPEFFVSINRSRDTALKMFRESEAYQHLISLRTSTLKDQAGITFESGNIVGNIEDVHKKVEEYVDAGANHMPLIFTAKRPEEMTEAMRLFAEEIVPSFR